MRILTAAPNGVTAATSMALIDEIISVALVAPPVELAKPDNEAEAYVEIVNGVLLVITRDQNNVVHFRAECEFRCVSADLLQHQALAAHYYILNQAGVNLIESDNSDGNTKST